MFADSCINPHTNTEYEQVLALDESEVASIKEGSFFGEIGCVLGTRKNAVIARTICDLYALAKGQVSGISHMSISRIRSLHILHTFATYLAYVRNLHHRDMLLAVCASNPHTHTHTHKVLTVMSEFPDFAEEILRKAFSLLDSDQEKRKLQKMFADVLTNEFTDIPVSPTFDSRTISETENSGSKAANVGLGSVVRRRSRSSSRDAGLLSNGPYTAGLKSSPSRPGRQIKRKSQSQLMLRNHSRKAMAKPVILPTLAEKPNPTIQQLPQPQPLAPLHTDTSAAAAVQAQSEISSSETGRLNERQARAGAGSGGKPSHPQGSAEVAGDVLLASVTKCVQDAFAKQFADHERRVDGKLQEILDLQRENAQKIQELINRSNHVGASSSSEEGVVFGDLPLM
jgi:hypothetical protein